MPCYLPGGRPAVAHVAGPRAGARGPHQLGRVVPPPPHGTGAGLTGVEGGTPDWLPRPKARRRSPAQASLAAAQRQVGAAVERSARLMDVPSNLDPPLAEASASEAPPFSDGCLLGFTEVQVAPCVFGDLGRRRPPWSCSATLTPPCGSRPWMP